MEAGWADGSAETKPASDFLRPGLFYTVLHSAKLAGVEPKEYLRQAVRAALQNQPVPLPHEVIR